MRGVEMPHRDQKVEAASPAVGRYLYCVADAVEQASLGQIGIGHNEVYTVPYRDISAVVHPCPAQLYSSDDKGVVKAWVLNHQKVVDTAWERWGTVLPLSFGTIVTGGLGEDAERKVVEWLQGDYDALKRKLGKVKGKAEYGVQVFWDAKVMAQELTRLSPELRELEAELATKPRGLAYMYRLRLENQIKKEMETKAGQCFRDFFQRVRKHADDVSVEKAKPAEPGRQMLLNLSCLMQRDRCPELGEELDQINRMEGFSVRFTGPWPPYSFVGPP